MTLTAQAQMRRRRAQAELVTRLRRILTLFLFAAGGVAGGLLGIFATPYLDRILTAMVLLAVLVLLARAVADFFRAP